jgi:ArsR family transcriptional regulator
VHLLAQGPLCVCHFQSILDLPQVTVSKHLAYLRKKELVEAQRHGQWMIYKLSAKAPRELHLHLQCLHDCVQSHPIFRNDLKLLKKVRCGCDWLPTSAPSPSTSRKSKKEKHHEFIRI